MNFPSGINVSIPGQLLLSGKSGPKQLQAPEQPVPLARMTDSQLLTFADEMLQIMAEGPDESAPELNDYIELLCLQVQREIMSRM